MESRKMEPMILHAGQQRRHRCKEMTFLSTMDVGLEIVKKQEACHNNRSWVMWLYNIKK